MTSSTTVKAVSNGTDTTTDVRRAPREHGIHRVQEEQVYHLTGLAESALFEAERLLHQVNNTASAARRIDHDGSRGSEPVDVADLATVISEALDCIDVAAETLSRLNCDIRNRQDDQS
jgi:hypothetical protein